MQVGFPGKQDLRWRLDAGNLREMTLGSSDTCGKEGKGRKQDAQREKLVCQEVSVETSADPTESSEAERTLQSRLELRARG